MTHSLWLGRMSDITSASDIIISQDVTNVSSQFSLGIEDPNEVDGERMQRNAAAGDDDALGQGCQTQTHSWSKVWGEVKLPSSLNIFWKINGS